MMEEQHKYVIISSHALSKENMGKILDNVRGGYLIGNEEAFRKNSNIKEKSEYVLTCTEELTPEKIRSLEKTIFVAIKPSPIFNLNPEHPEYHDPVPPQKSDF